MANDILYDLTPWEDAPSTLTPINAENLNARDSLLKKVVDKTNQLSGQIADLKENGTGGEITDEQISEAVSSWLDEHPEATTTVQDGSITEQKLAPELLNKLVFGDVEPVEDDIPKIFIDGVIPDRKSVV